MECPCRDRCSFIIASLCGAYRISFYPYTCMNISTEEKKSVSMTFFLLMWSVCNKSFMCALEIDLTLSSRKSKHTNGIEQNRAGNEQTQ